MSTKDTTRSPRSIGSTRSRPRGM